MARWFEELFGKPEPSDAGALREQFKLEEEDSANAPKGAKVLVAPSGERFAVGALSTPSVAELRAAVKREEDGPIRVKVSHVAVGDVLDEHWRNAGATIQAASQFNGLEFASPAMTPEDGIAGYAYDRTQGPACALACAPATLVRNYFVEAGDDGALLRVVGDAPGQSRDSQLCGLRPVLGMLGAAGAGVVVRNGYTFEAPGADGARHASNAAAAADQLSLTGALRVAVVRNAQVVYSTRFERTADTAGRVTQVYCSALSVGYAGGDSWMGLARVVLDAAYEATLLVAEEERVAGRGSGVVLLTSVGGGVFRNEAAWIAASIGRAVGRCAHLPLDVRLCHYRDIDENMRGLVDCAVWRALYGDTREEL